MLMSDVTASNVVLSSLLGRSNRVGRGRRRRRWRRLFRIVHTHEARFLSR